CAPSPLKFYTLSLHDALPIFLRERCRQRREEFVTIQNCGLIDLRYDVTDFQSSTGIFEVSYQFQADYVSVSVLRDSRREPLLNRQPQIPYHTGASRRALRIG